MPSPTEEPPSQGGDMPASSLLSSRFRPRRVRGRRLERARLIERLDEAANDQLTLVTAPAGFGKSTLLAQWAAVSELPVTWVSLTAAENDPQLMAAYLAAAIRAAGEPSSDSRELDTERPTLGPDQLMTELLGELAGMTTPIVLVLDDYHVIEADAAHDIVQMLFDDAPETVRLIVSCRTLPPRVLACLADGAVLPRIDANDLRFTLDETYRFFDLISLDLPDDDILVLNARINGWIAGIQMFAITLGESETSPAEALSGFDATSQLLHDFLLQEVFDKQTAEMQAFLLRSALFTRVSPDLCRGAMEPGQPANDLLEQAIQGQLFLTPHDSDDGWFEYESLFHNFLLQRAQVVLGERERTVLYRRAAYWCEREGLTDDAIEYALAGEDWPHAATMVLPAVMAMFGSDEITKALDWLQVLPEDLFESDAELAVVAAWAYIRAGSLTDVPRLLTIAQRWYEETADRLGLANVSGAFAELGRYKADGSTTIRYARLARELLAGDERSTSTPSPLQRLGTMDAVTLRRRIDALSRLQAGTGLFRQGKVNEAAEELLAAHAYAVAHNTPEYEAATMLQLGHVRMLQGRLDDAIACYQAVPSSPDWYIVSRRIALTGLAEIQRERRQFAHAQQYLDECQEIVDNSPLGFGLWNLRMSQARLAWSRRAASQAHEYAELAMRRTRAAGLAWHAGIAETLAVRVRLSNGDIGPALEWAHDRRLAPDDPPDFVRLHEHLVYARLLIAQGSPEDSIDLLTGSLYLAEEDGRIGDAIEICVLLGLACLESADLGRAADALGRALRYGERGGYLQMFADDGLPMMQLLELAQDSEVTPSYYQRILDILLEPEQSPAMVDSSVRDDPISTRELEVLQLISRGLTNLEIADALRISGNTVKHRVESVHGKLGVWTHVEALHKARALGLLSTNDD